MQQAMAAAERVFTLLDTKEPDAAVFPPLSRSARGSHSPLSPLRGERVGVRGPL
jgi:hypothetical protein